MIARSSFFALVLAAGLVLASGPASSEQAFFVSGMLDEVDQKNRTVMVGQTTVKVMDSTEIKDAEGVRGGWGELFDRDGENVEALVVRGSPYPYAKVLLLVDEDSDGD